MAFSLKGWLMGGSAARSARNWERGITWSDWRGINKDPIPATLKDLNFRDHYDPITVVIEQHDGRWFYSKLPLSKDLVPLKLTWTYTAVM